MDEFLEEGEFQTENEKWDENPLFCLCPCYAGGGQMASSSALDPDMWSLMGHCIVDPGVDLYISLGVSTLFFLHPHAGPLYRPFFSSFWSSA